MANELPAEEYPIRFDNREHASKLAYELIKGASRSICFFGPSIDTVLFNHQDTIQLLSDFARRSPRTLVRFVVFDTSKNISQSHLLLPLAKKLTSKIKIHIAHKRFQETSKMFLLVDSNAYLYCPNNTQYDGYVDIDAAAKVRELQQEFDEIWAHSTPDPNTRRLHL